MCSHFERHKQLTCYAPPNDSGPKNFTAQNVKFTQFFFARFARDKFQNNILIKIEPKHAKINFTSTINRFNNFRGISYPPPLSKSMPT